MGTDPLSVDLPKGAKPATLTRLLDIARRLAAERPLEDVTIADVARLAKLSWPTVRRYLGSKENLHALLKQENPALAEPGESATRRSILEAATKVFARSGFAGATLDEVGSEAGMTKGAVYWHFASKADLFLALVDECAVQQFEGMPERVEAALAMDDPREGLARILALQLAAAKAAPALGRLFLEFLAQSRDDDVRARLARGYGRTRVFMTDLARTLQKRGRVSEKVEPEAFAMLWTALLDGLIVLSLADPEVVDPERLAPQIVELIWNGMKRRYGGL